MTSLEQSISRFIEAFGRDGRDAGQLALGRNATPLPQNLPLTGQIGDFYTNTMFNDELQIDGALLINLYPATKLATAQQGWRWIVTPKGELVENSQFWQKEWVVIGDLRDDAIFVKTDTDLSPVFGTIQADSFFQLSSSLTSFLLILADCLIMEELEFDFDTKTDDFVPKPEFIERIRAIILKYEEERIADEFVAFFFA